MGLHIFVMITSIDLSQEIFVIDILKALKSSLKYRRKHHLVKCVFGTSGEYLEYIGGYPSTLGIFSAVQSGKSDGI